MQNRLKKFRRLWIKGCFLSLEMAQWLSASTPHSSTSESTWIHMAEAWIPPEPSNLCLGRFALSLLTAKSKTKNNTVRRGLLSPLKPVSQSSNAPYQTFLLRKCTQFPLQYWKVFISLNLSQASRTAPHCKPLGIRARYDLYFYCKNAFWDGCSIFKYLWAWG